MFPESGFDDLSTTADAQRLGGATVFVRLAIKVNTGDPLARKPTALRWSKKIQGG
jgi:hypothetical protein